MDLVLASKQHSVIWYENKGTTLMKQWFLRPGDNEGEKKKSTHYFIMMFLSASIKLTIQTLEKTLPCWASCVLFLIKCCYTV